METPVSVDLKELLGSVTSEIRVEANAYRTRSVYQLELNGRSDEWHSVKGGLNPQKFATNPTRVDDVSYEVFFNPITKQWLKVVPPEATQSDLLTKRLNLACEIGKAALDVAGLGYLIPTFETMDVNLRGSKNRAFLSPHLGPSLQYFITQVGQGPRHLFTPPEHRELFRRIFGIAFEQAKELYLKYGYWTKDPNPGNIILHPTGDSCRVVLIDFTSKHQLSDNRFEHIPDPERRQKQADKLMRRLKQVFQDECRTYSVGQLE